MLSRIHQFFTEIEFRAALGASCPSIRHVQGLRGYDNDNDNEIGLFRHHNGNNTNIKVIYKQVTMLDKCNCI